MITCSFAKLSYFKNILYSPIDLKLHLQTTDYGNFLANEAGPLTVAIIDERLREKLVVEFEHLRNQAVEPLATFLDFITYVVFFYPLYQFFFLTGSSQSLYYFYY